MTSHLSAGIIAATVQPFEENGAIDWPTTARYIAQVAQAHPAAIAVNMAVGEVSSLDEDEQLENVRRCKLTVAGACALLAGLSVTNTRAAIELSRKLVDAGAEG